MSNKKIKVLQLIHNLAVGGAEKVVVDLVNELDDSKIEVHLVSILEEDYLRKNIKNKIPITIFGAQKKIFSFIQLIHFLIKYIKTHQIQIIHAHLIYSCFVGLIVKIFKPKIKLVYSPHTISFNSGFLRFILMISKKWRDADIIFSSEMLNRLFKKNAVVIPNGIKIYSTTLSKFSAFTFITIGRLVPVKNHFFLIDCIQTLKEKILQPFQLLIVGDGELYDALKKQITQKKLEHYIQLLGYRENVIELCAQSHVFVMCSFREGMPISILEAGSCGLPVITTPVGSIPSVIQNENGFLSSFDEFAETMYHVYDKYEMAIKRGKQLKKLIHSQYSVEAMVKSHENLYFSL